MIGTGVFTTTGFLVRDVGSIPAVVAIWAVGGVVACCGALAYAELGAALPENGGEYYLLSRIYHPGLGFVSGWVSLVVGFSAPMAAAALAFGAYLERLIPSLPALWVALALIGVLSLLHALRVRLGGGVQTGITVMQLLLILVFIAIGLPNIDVTRLAVGSERFGSSLASPAFAVGLVYVSFSYSGWNAASYVAGEVREPARALPRALLGGTAFVTVVYVLLNLVFVASAPVEALSGVLEVGHVAASHLLGPPAAVFMTMLVLLSLATTVGALAMTGPRVYEAMGRDHAALRRLVRGSSAGGPRAAIALQTILAVAMVLSARFDALLSYMGFTLSLFAGLTIAGVVVLRRREPGLERPYRTWGYPVTPLIALMLMAWMVVHALLERPKESLFGVGTLLVGATLYLVLRRSGSRAR
jgi:APA family basic amino acid/polyamine antiporter